MGTTTERTEARAPGADELPLQGQLSTEDLHLLFGDDEPMPVNAEVQGARLFDWLVRRA